MELLKRFRVYTVFWAISSKNWLFSTNLSWKHCFGMKKEEGVAESLLQKCVFNRWEAIHFQTSFLQYFFDFVPRWSSFNYQINQFGTRKKGNHKKMYIFCLQFLTFLQMHIYFHQKKVKRTCLHVSTKKFWMKMKSNVSTSAHS